MNVRPEVAEVLRAWVRKAEHDLEAAQRIIEVEADCPLMQFVFTASKWLRNI